MIFSFDSPNRKGQAINEVNLPLLQHEINPVIAMAKEKDIQVAALHNHWIYVQPLVLGLHLQSIEHPLAFAKKMQRIVSFLKGGINYAEQLCNQLVHILGEVGRNENGICSVEVPRINPAVSIQGQKTNGLLGIEMHFTFESTDMNGHTLNLGDIPLLEHGVNPVMSVLVQYGIYIAALHNQFIFDDPRIMYLHIQSVQNPIYFAQAVRYALSATQNLQSYGTPFVESNCTNPNCLNPNCQCGENCKCGPNYQY